MWLAAHTYYNQYTMQKRLVLLNEIHGKKNILITHWYVKLKGINIKFPTGNKYRNFTLATCCLPGILAATHHKRI